jgi:chitin-binding protein
MTMLIDTNREPGTTYQYLVVAVDETGNRSAASNQLAVTTDAAETTETAPEPEPALESQPVESGTWDRFASYTVGDTVTHADSIYEAVQSHTGNGDPNWIYAPSLWVAVTKDSTPHVDQGSAPKAEIQSWNATGTHAAGDRVSNSGLIYEAVQSHTGNGDPNWIYAPSLWKLI